MDATTSLALKGAPAGEASQADADAPMDEPATDEIAPGELAADDIAADEITVQRLVLPDPEVNSRLRLFCHGVGGAGFDDAERAFYARAGARLKFDSWFNAFHATGYDLDAGDEVRLRLEGEGVAILKVHMSRVDRNDDTLISRQVELVPGNTVELRLPALRDPGVIHLRLRARTRLLLRRADWSVRSPRLREAKINAVITTFKRDAAVQATGRRLSAWLADNPDVAARFRLTVVDNGGDTDAVEGAQLLKNRNLGGAGGFTRGLLEAKADPSVTHVLFMDDDAEFFPENLRRTLGALRLAASDKAAVAGAMLPTAKRWQMWENTAVFDKLCRPLMKGLNLRRFESVMLVAQSPRNVARRYAGWWYFCFPIAHVRHLPFPFFVRGDDVWFSLANDFEIRTLLGVCSHQDDFVSKRSPLTAYLDARYHIIQMLAHEGLPSDAKTLHDQLVFLYRQWNESYHYGSAAAVIQAIKDVTEGPDFFDRDPEMSEKRAQIKAMAGPEAEIRKIKWDAARFVPVPAHKHTKFKWQAVRFLTFNGHLAPRRQLYSKPARFDMDTRCRPNQVFLRRAVVVVDAATGEGYRLARDSKRYFENRRRFRAAFKALKAKLPELREAYAVRNVKQISEEAWRKRLGI